MGEEKSMGQKNIFGYPEWQEVFEFQILMDASSLVEKTQNEQIYSLCARFTENMM